MAQFIKVTKIQEFDDGSKTFEPTLVNVDVIECFSIDTTGVYMIYKDTRNPKTGIPHFHFIKEDMKYIAQAMELCGIYIKLPPVQTPTT